jgi:hypothetical protein
MTAYRIALTVDALTMLLSTAGLNVRFCVNGLQVMALSDDEYTHFMRRKFS